MTITGTQTWKGVAESNVVPVASITYDPSITGFSFEKNNVAQNVYNSTASGANGIILSNNTNRISFFVQNLSAGSQLFLKFGTGASSASFNVVLQPDSFTDSGKGGTYTNDFWKGDVSVSGAISPRYISWELTP